MATNLIDFPRGGEEVKLPQRKRKREEHKSIFKNSGKEEHTKKRKTLKFKSNKTTFSTPAAPLIIEKRRTPGWIHLKNVSEDTLVLGVVKEIQDVVVLVSLPYNMIGRIDISDVSAVLSQNILEKEFDKSLQNLFHTGQFLACRVKQVGRSALGLTCDPVTVNSRVSSSAIQTGFIISGVITSREDHGNQISFGVEGRVGFLLNKRAKAYIQRYNDGQPLTVGQVLLCYVEGSGTRAVPVSIDLEKIKTAQPPLHSSFDNVLPFQPVKGDVTGVSDSSLSLEVSGGFTASCAPPHLKRVSDGPEGYSKGAVKGRVIWVRQEEKQIGVSLKKSLLRADTPAPVLEGFEIGDTYEAAEVVRSERRGLFLKLTDLLTGYCPVHYISDESVSRPDKTHRIGTAHKCRVISYNLLDDTLLVSMRESVIEEKFLNFKFVKVGDVVQGKIVSRSDKGLLVSLSPHVRGFCHKGQYSERDKQSKYKQKRLQEGCEDTFRVLRIESRQRLTLTHKRGLVRSSLPVLSEYSAAVVGHRYHGYVSGVRDFGCVVRFFQEVRGILHRSRLQLLPLQSVSDIFYEGQVLECSVFSCLPAEQKLELSLATDTPEGNAASLENFSEVCLCVGGISPTGLELFERGTKERAALPMSHLSDYPEIQEMRFRSLQKRIETGDQLEIGGLYVYTQSCSSSVCVVSLKESLGRDMDRGVSLLTAEMETGLLAHGVVRRVEKYGCIVVYPGGASGLLPNRYIRDSFVDSPAGVLGVGDTVLTRVMEVEEDRFVVSSRDSDVISNEPPDRDSLSSAGEWFQAYLSTRDTFLREVSACHFTPGDVMGCTLLEKGQGGTIVSLDGGSIATAVGLAAGELEEGDAERACFLGLSTCPLKLFVSLSSELVEAYSTENWSGAELAVGSSVEARVQLVLPRYMVGIVGTLRGPRLMYIIRESAVSTRSLQSLVEEYLNKKVSVVIVNNELYSLNVVLGLLSGGSQLSTSQKRQLVRGQDSIRIGAVVTAQVREVHPLMLKVRIGTFSGRIHACEVSDRPAEGEFPTNAFKKGEIIKATVVAKTLKQTGTLLKREYTVLELSMRTSETAQLGNIGDKYHGCVEEIWPASNLVVRIGINLSLYIPILLCSCDIDVLQDLKSNFKLGQAVNAEFIKKNTKGKNSIGALIERSDLAVGSKLTVQIQQIYSNQALLVTLPFGGTGRIDVTDLSDSYSREMTGVYSDKQLLEAKIVAIEEQRTVLSTRDSIMSEFLITEPAVKDRVIASIHDLTKGEILRGFVKSATDVGVFVKLSRELTGRVRIKNISDQFIREFKDKFPVGKLVKCKVLNIDSENGYVDLSIRLSHTNPEKFALLCAEKGKPDKNKKINKMKENRLKKGTQQTDSGEEEISEVTKVRNVLEASNQSSSDEDIAELDLEEIQSLPMGTQNISNKRRHQGSLSRLEGIGGLKWEWEKSERNGISESDQSEEETPVKKKTKRQKKAAKRVEEESIYRAEQCLLDSSREPKCAEDFDRLLLANPNSSFLWIQYVAYQLHLADVEKARETGRKALESINFRMEEEKLNVWISLLNLENNYGTPDSLVSLFQEALRENDTETLHFKLAQIYTNSNKEDQAEGIYLAMTRKLGNNPRVWKEYGQLLMQTGKVEQARKVCENALQKLAERFHVEVLSKFGQFEFKYGEFERGRTIFETLLSNHPRRTDVWFVYIDTLTKYDTADSVREVCERGTHLNLSVSKMKAFYKKYLAFEQNHGSREDMERVMENARKFVESKLSQETD